MKKAVMYMNQFFGQIGGEDQADYAPEIRQGFAGPGVLLNELLEHSEITHTVICGDNYMSSHTKEAVEAILDALEGITMDLFIAGPAFQAGRYGVACGEICKAVKEKFGIPVITSMHTENPGVEMFKKQMYIMKGANSAAKMRNDLKAMAQLSNKLLHNRPILGAVKEGYFERGIRHQVWLENPKPAADRAVEMLLEKISAQPYVTELPIPKMDRVPIAPPVRDLKTANIALVTTGGIVPVDNPDRIQSASATRWGRYDITDVEDLKSGVYKTIHAGFDPAAADADPDVIMPIDVLKVFEREGKFKKLHPYFYSTVGTGTTQAEAQRMAGEIVPYLQKDHVDGVILVST